jgi:tetratricopeptide (TPR) repeat protein
MLAIERAIADELNRPDLLWGSRVHECARVLMDGDYDRASRLADEALSYMPSNETALQMYGVARFELGRARGGLEELEPVVTGMVEQYPLLPAWRTGLVYLYSMLERPDEVRAQLDILAADDFEALPRDANWSVAVAILIASCAYIGDAQRAARLYEMLDPYSDSYTVAGSPALVVGSNELFLALAAATAGRWDTADEHFSRAVEGNTRSGNRPWLVHGNWEYARLLSRRDDHDARDRIRDLLCDCMAGATEMGMTRVVAQTRELAEASGVTLD